MNATATLGIRGRLLATVLPLVVCGFVVVWLITTARARHDLVALTDANLTLAAQNLANELTRTLDDAATDAITSSRLDLAAEAIESGDPKNFVWYADQLVRSKGRYAAMVVNDERGKVLAGNHHDLRGAVLPRALEGGSLADAAWAKATNDGDTSDRARINEATGLELLSGLAGAELGTLAFTRPVIDVLDEPIGALTFFLSRSALADRLALYSSRKGEALLATAVVIDAAGAVVIAPRDTPTDWSFAIATSAEERHTWESPKRVAYHTASAPIGGALASRGWRLLVMNAASVVDAPIEAMTRRLSLTFAGMLVVLALGVAFAGARIVGPLVRLTSSARQATRASQFVPITVEGADEVGELARSFNAMMDTILGHERDLEAKVAARTRELAEAKREVTDILDNMAQAIFTVGESGRINRQFSARCRDVFERDDVAGLDAMDLLGIDAAPKEAATRTRFWLGNIIGGDSLQWALSAEDPLKETILSVGGSKKVLTLDYAPIYVDGRVDRVMFIATDVTALRDLAEQLRQTEEQNRTNLARVAEIIALDGALFRTFVQETDHLMQEARRGADELAADPTAKDALAAVFRAVHTFKSNARIFKLTTIQNAAHDLEELLATLRDRAAPPSAGETNEVLAGLDRLQTLRAEFEALAARIFGPLRGESSGSANTIAIAEAKVVALRRAYAELTRMLREAPVPAAVTTHTEAVGQAIGDLTRMPMSELIERFRKMLFDLAKELGRDVDDLALEGGDVHVDIKLIQLLRDVLGHALRNAVDHGVEDPETRKLAGKPPKGRVAIACALDDTAMTVTVSDDGRGIDYERVRAKALAAGLLDAEKAGRASQADLIELLFMPGFSTADRVTAISGRGVGMDVIRTSMRGLKGEATIVSQPGMGTRLELRLPSDYYVQL